MIVELDLRIRRIFINKQDYGSIDTGPMKPFYQYLFGIYRFSQYRNPLTGIVEISINPNALPDRFDKIIEQVNKKTTKVKPKEKITKETLKKQAEILECESIGNTIEDIKIYLEGEKMSDKTDRIRRGLSLFENGRVRETKTKIRNYEVRGEGDLYQVEHNTETNEWKCTCPDHSISGYVCKHIWSCMIKEMPIKTVQKETKNE
jgi:hypothetical protein